MLEFVTHHQLRTIEVLALLLSVCACATRYVVHPGAVNKADSAAYDALLIAEMAIDQARLDYKAGKIPKERLAALIQTYNVARESWLTYRGAIATNDPPQTYLDKLTQNLSDLSNAIRQFEEAK